MRLLTLGAWLGPLGPSHGRPQSVARSAMQVPVDDGTCVAWVYRPARPSRAHILLAPGVHYDGPTDPRLDRFARILCSMGANVLVPFPRDFMRLMVTSRVIPDVESAWRAYRDTIPDFRPGDAAVVSLSFGCLPAARVATSEEHAGDFSLFLPFGGYADFGAAMHFAMTGEDPGQPSRPHDPLNRPVAFATLIEQMDFAPVDPQRLRRRWLRFARRTWGRPEMRQGQRHVTEALAEAEGLAGLEREVLLMGCGAADGGVEVCQAALQRVDSSFTAPFIAASRLRSRVVVVHGADDDVIAPTQAEAIRRWVEPHAPVEVHVTGLYGHTGAQGAGARGLVRELRTLGRVLSGFAAAAEVRAGR